VARGPAIPDLARERRPSRLPRRDHDHRRHRRTAGALLRLTRRVSRHGARISDEAWTFLMPREQPSDTAFDGSGPGFSGRFIGTFEDGGDTIVGSRAVVVRRRELAGRPTDHLPTRVRSSGLAPFRRGRVIDLAR
jgi:hypothetical protein